MKRSIGFAAALASLIGMAGGAQAFVPTSQKSRVGIPLGIRVVRPEVVSTSPMSVPILNDGKGKTPKANVMTDAVSGAVRVLSGSDLAGDKSIRSASADDFEAMARAFVTANPEMFTLKNSELVLDRQALHISKREQFVKLRVRRDGLEVADASIDFRFKFGRLVQVASHAFTEAVSDLRPAKGNLGRSAESALLGGEARQMRELYRVEQDKSGYHLVRVTEFETAAQDGQRFLVQVENATGKIFEMRPTTFSLNGGATASAYPRWYGEAIAQIPMPLLNLGYNGGSVMTDGEGRFFDAPQAAQPKLNGFMGSKVKIQLRSGSPVSQDGALVRDEWQIAWQAPGSSQPSNDLNVAQSMVFYHTNVIIDFAKQILPDVSWLDQTLTANTNLTQTCNAHWDGSTINLYSGGSGCANTALIADVIYHEWGHGLDANTGGIEDGGFSEGFGDIMSLSITGSNILGIGFRTSDNSPVRDLEPDKIYPRDAGGEVHAEGLIIASTFYDLFKSLRDKYGEQEALAKIRYLAMKVILTASRYTDVYDALLVIDDDNGDLSDLTPNYCEINKNFAAHGLATPDQACELATIDDFAIDDAAGNGNGIIEPGEHVNLWMTARNSGTLEATNLVGQLAVAGASGIDVTQSTLNFGTIPAHEQRRSENAAELTVAETVACGQTFSANVQLTAGERHTLVTKTLLVGRLDAEPVARSAAGLPTPINDNSTTEAPLAVSGPEWDGGTAVYAGRLKFDITHSYVGDLTVKLVAPNNAAVEIFRGSGSGDDVHFDADISGMIAGMIGGGTWKLQVTDNASQDTGTLDSFTLTLTAKKFICE